MDDAEYNRLWAKIDDAHIRIGRLEGEREMLIRELNAMINAYGGDGWEKRYALHSAKQLLETMKGE